MNLEQHLADRQIDLHEAIGKTIKGHCNSWCECAVAILYDDGTFSYQQARRDRFEDALDWECGQISMDDENLCILVHAGVISEKEYKEHLEKEYKEYLDAQLS